MTKDRYMKGLKRSALTLALGMCFVGAAIAQSSSGGLRISLTGNSGQPLAGATVKVSSPSSLVAKTGVTGADGSVNLVGLDPATNYTVEVIAPGTTTSAPATWRWSAARTSAWAIRWG